MPFVKGNKHARGGQRLGAGRPTVPEALAKATTQQRAIKRIEAAADKIIDRYLKRAIERKADRVLCHAVDKLVPSTIVAKVEQSIDRAQLMAIMQDPKGRQLAEELTRLLVSSNLSSTKMKT